MGGGFRCPLFGDFVGIFCCQWGQGPTDAQRPGPLSGKGAFCVPPHRPFFTRTLLFSPPQVFFSFLAVGANACCGELNIVNATLRLEFVLQVWNIEFRELSTNSLKHPVTPKPRVMSGFSYELGGNAVRFFFEVFSGDLPSYFCDFRSSVCLRFLAGEFFTANSEMGVRGFLGLKTPVFVPETAKKKFSLS